MKTQLRNRRPLLLGGCLALFWISLIVGPATALDEWEPIGPWGGDRFRIYLDPLDPQRVYSVGSSIHRSEDGGELWTTLNHPEAPSRGLSAFSLAIDPTDTDILYVGTMEGVWKSTDGGMGWLPFNEGIPDSDQYIRNVVLDRDDHDVLYAGISAIYVFQSMMTDDDAAREIASPVYRSVDGGATWQAFSAGLPAPYSNVNAVYQNPVSGELFLATWGSGIFRYDPVSEQWISSSNGLRDPEGLYVTHIAFHPTNPDILFCATGKDWIYESTDGGESWQHIEFPGELTVPYPPLAVFCAMDPANPDWVWASALPGDGSDETPFYFAESDQDTGGLFLSTDGGASWDVTGWTDLSFGSYGPYSITFDPSETVGEPPYVRSRVAYMAGLALTGVMKTTDGHETYTAMVEGENGLLMHTMTQHPADPAKLFASTESVLHFSFDRGVHWSHFTPVGASGGAIWIRDIALDPDNPELLYYATGEPAFVDPNDKGLYALDLTSLDPDKKLNITGPGDQFPSTAGIGIWKVYPRGGGVFYLATQDQGILRSTDGGETWSPVNTGLEATTVACLLFDEAGNPSFAGTRTSHGAPGEQIFIHGEAGALYRWDPEEEAWERVDEGEIDHAVLAILRDPAEPSRIFVATLDGVFRSDDGGVSWTRKDWGLPAGDGFYVSDLAMDPDDPNRLYLSSYSYGVYLSMDGGDHWQPYRNELFPWYVAGIRQDLGEGNLLYAITQGGSILKCEMGAAPEVLVVEANEEPLSGPPFSCRTKEEEVLQVWIDGSDPDGDSITYSALLNDGEVPAPDEVEDPETTYTFDPATQTFHWKPPYTSSEHSPARLTFVLDDGSFKRYVDVEVEIDPIHPPEVDGVTANGRVLTEPYGMTAKEMEWLEVEVTAHDEDGDVLTYEAYLSGEPVPAPDEVEDPETTYTFDPATRIFRWRPPYTASEHTPHVLSFVVRDGILLTQVDVEITVEPIHPPEVDGITANGEILTEPYGTTVKETEWLEVEVTAHDVDGDLLTYEAYLLGERVPTPGEVEDPDATYTFDPATQTFRWKPPYTASAQSPYLLSFVVKDGILVTQVDVEITVEPLQPPVVESVTANGTVLEAPYVAVGKEMEWLEVQVEASDPDGDSLQYAAYFAGARVPAPGEVADPDATYTFDPATQTFRWRPPYTASNYGPFKLRFVVLDGIFVTQADVSVQIVPPLDPVVDQIIGKGEPLDEPRKIFVREKEALDLQVVAHDAEGGSVRYACYFMGQRVPTPDAVSYPPEYYSFDAETGTFQWIPLSGKARATPYWVVFVVVSETHPVAWTYAVVEVYVGPEAPCEDCFDLPEAGEYGMIRDGDVSHVDQVSYRFEGRPGDVTVSYEGWDVDFGDEVEILINGVLVGYVGVTENEAWGGTEQIVLPDAAVMDVGENVLVFSNKYNPPSNYLWGVARVSIVED